ncbi:MAG: hypothetical protein K2W96_16950 [Gemmataceae bacterium]|nr:hypothetical protein [Gemmataceae bacterium]
MTRDRNRLPLPGLLAVAALFLSSGQASASCGSHAVLPGEEAHHPMHADAPAPCGCVGAECGVPETPSSLPPSSAARVAPLSETLAVEVVAADPVASGRRSDDASLLPPSPEADPVFHPPRA